MKRMTTTVLLSALLLLAGALPAAETASDKLQMERSRQDSIYHSKGQQRPEGYVIDRSLTSYKAILPQEFAQTLSLMGPKDRWLDIGAGRGQAVLDYCTAGADRSLNARVVAMSIEDRRTPEWHQAAASIGADRMQYVFGKRLSEYSQQELGQFRVITDVIGGFSYTDRLSVFMERVLALLDTGGAFYTVLQDVHSAEGSNKPHYEGAPYLTVLSNAGGAPVKVCDWLKSISCVEVTCALKTAWKPPIEVYGIRKVCNEVKVPLLTMIHYEAGTPPERGFRLAQ